jgi:DNA-binding transcriptional ArsR family regulator
MTQPAVNLEAVPATLRARAQWGLWRVERDTKIPYQATAPRRAKSDDPATWTTYARAERAYRPGRDAGLAWFFSPDDGLTGIDLDKCRDPETGAISDAARALLDTLDSYCEVSPSGTGVKVWVLGKLPKSFRATAPAAGIARIEVYSDRRFFAVTGQRLDGYPAEPQERQAELDALAARYGRPEPATAAQEGQQPADRAPEWARRKLTAAANKVALARDGEKHDELLKAAKLAGGVAELSDVEIENALMAALGGRAEDDRGARQTIRDGIAYGRSQPLTPPATPGALVWRGRRPYCPDCGAEARPSKYHDGFYCPTHEPSYNWRGAEARPPAGQEERVRPDEPAAPVEPATWAVRGTTLAQLQHAEFPPEVWVVDGILPPGACLLAAKPKKKKSWLALQAGICVAMGRPFMGRFSVTQGRVLYLDLEGTQRRIKKRTRAMLGVNNVAWPDNFHIFTEWQQGPDALADLDAWFVAYPDTRLVVIDVLASFRRPMDPKESFYQYDRVTVKPINDLLERYDCAGILVHHLNKARVDDVFDSISGSTGLLSVTNTQWAMGMSPEDRNLTIFAMQGRDLESIAAEPLGLRWNDYAHQHEVEGAAAEVAVSIERRAVLATLDDDEPRTPKEIAEELGKPTSAVKRLLSKMLDDGQVDKAGYGQYVLVRGASGGSGARGVSGGSGLSSRVTADAPRDTAEGQETPVDGGGGVSSEARQDAADGDFSAKSDQRHRDSNDPLARLPASALTSIRLYVRAGDVAKARAVCERHGGDWATISEALRRAA